MPRRVAALFLALSLAGCAAHREYREGVKAEDIGRDWVAAEHYIAALDRNPGMDKARAALFDVAPDAFARQLKRCEDAERARDWPLALQEYAWLKELVDRVDREGGPDLTDLDLAGKIDDMANAAAREHYDLGQKALTEKRWADAIAQFEEVGRYKADYKDTHAKIGAAHYGWGESHLASKAWRDAAAEFDLSARHQGPKDATARSTGIYAALGKYHLDKGACRQAARDLKSAASGTQNATVLKNLAAAEACAAVPLAFLPLENATGTRAIDGLAIGDYLNDTLAADLRAHASPYVEILDRSVLAALLTEAGLTDESAVRGSSKLKKVRYFVVGKLNLLKIDAPAPRLERRTTTGKRAYACTQTDAAGAEVQSTCEEAVSVTYNDHVASVAVRVSGSVRAVDARSGALVVSHPFEHAASDATRWADDFRIGREAADPRALSVPADVLALADAKQTVATPGGLVEVILQQISNDAAAPLLSVVDAEPSWADPAALTVAPIP